MATIHWWRSRYFWKLYAGFIAVIVVFAMLMALVLSRIIVFSITTEIEHNLRNQALMLRQLALPALSEWESLNLQSTVQHLGQETGVRLTVVRSDGVVLADSREDPRRMANHLNREEIRQAGTQDYGVARHYSETLQIEMMYVAVAVQDHKRTLGYARAAYPLTTINLQLKYMRLFTISWALVIAVLALVVGAVIAQRIVRPVASVTAAARALAAGDYSRELAHGANDEIGELSRAFESLRRELRSRIEMLTSERNQLSGILTGMVEGVIAVDRDERILHLNEVAAALFGVQPGQCLGQRVWEVIRNPAVVNAISTAMRSTAVVQQELSIAREGKDCLLELHASPLHDSQGRLAGAVLVLHDVTELRRLETVRREFVANVSHELKTPLTAIHGFVETMLDDEQMPPDVQRRFLGKLRDQSSRLAAIVSDLLTLSRVESEQNVFDTATLDLREPVQEATAGLTALADERELALVCSLPDVPVPVNGDHEALRQAVGNLLDNAIKYTPAGGSIRLSVQVRAGQAVVEVADSGIGIEPQEQQRIFERFYRVDKARSRALGGTGLGLSIVKHITLALGGQVAVESVPGQGSLFRITLPLATGDRPSAAADNATGC